MTTDAEHIARLEEERDGLLLQLSHQVHITTTFADRAEAWHAEYWELKNRTTAALEALR